MELVYYTGGNELDSSTRQISRDNAKELLLAQKENTFAPICSAIIMDEQKKVYKIIYFQSRVIFISFLSNMQIWYERTEQTTYYIDKIIAREYEYKQKKAIVELNFRNQNFSEPNICMIHISYSNIDEYYLGNIDSSLFCRNIKFGEIETFLRDIEFDFKAYIYDCHKADKNFNII